MAFPLHKSGIFVGKAGRGAIEQVLLKTKQSKPKVACHSLPERDSERQFLVQLYRDRPLAVA